MLRPIIGIIAVFIFGCIQITAQSHQTSPLLINISGELYQWSPGNPEPTPVGCDLQGNSLHRWERTLIQAGRWAAFMVLPSDMEMGAPSPTGNLWVCDVNTGEAYALSETDPNYPNLVSHGSFSPDGQRIAWSEVIDFTDPSLARILVHHFASHETRVLVESTPSDDPCGVNQGAPRVNWGQAGIAVGYYQTDGMCGEVEDVGFYVYAEGGTFTQYPITTEEVHIGDFQWVGETELDYRLLDFRNDTLTQYSLDLTTKAITEQDSFIEAYLSGHYLIPNETHLSEFIPPLIYLPGTDQPLETLADVAFAPDGSLMVLVIGSQIYIAEDGNLEAAPWNFHFYPLNLDLDSPIAYSGQLEIAWASPDYRPVVKDSIQSVCPSVEKQEYVDRQGQVIEGLSDNNLRSAPWSTARVLGSIPEGEAFTLLEVDFDGVVACSDGIRWLQVEYQGTVGWTAEAQDETYFIQPPDSQG